MPTVTVSRGGSAGLGALVVSGPELLAVLQPHVRQQDHERAEALAAGEWADRHRASPILGGSGWLSEASGLNARSVRRILAGQQWVSLSTADALLTAAGLSSALRDGRVRVVPNPKWSAQRWAARMHACGIEDPDEVL
jgi:hypothetical protein